MAQKSFNEKLNDSKDMPKIIEITDERSVKRYGGTQMLIAPPLEYNGIMAQIPEGKVITISEIREFLAEKHNAEFTRTLSSRDESRQLSTSLSSPASAPLHSSLYDLPSAS